MTKKTVKPLRKIKYTVREITDPAEQAALDERIKRGEAYMAAKELQDALHRAATADLVLELCRRLSAEERLRVAGGLTEQLPVEQRSEFVERVTSRCGTVS
jgi:hypothetical protein